MPNPVLPSLDAAQVLEALSRIVERAAANGPPADVGAVPGADERWALASALALRHIELPQVKPEGEGARVLPFPVAGRPRADERRDAREAPVVSLAQARSTVAGEDRSEPGPAAAPAAALPESAGMVRIVPAPGEVFGLDEGAARLTVFRSLDRGHVLGREVAPGARIVVSQRAPVVGDVAVYATRRTIGLCPRTPPPRGARILGVVEAVIS